MIANEFDRQGSVDVEATSALLSDPNLALAVGLSLILSASFGCLGYQIFKRRDL